MLYYVKMRDGDSGRIETVGAGEGPWEAREKLAGVLGFLLVSYPELFDPVGDAAEAYWGTYDALRAGRVEEAVEGWNARNVASGGNYLSLVGADGAPVMELGGDCYYQHPGHPDAPPEQEGAYARWQAGAEEVALAGERRYGQRVVPQEADEADAVKPDGTAGIGN